MAKQQEIVKSTMKDLIKKEKESNEFRDKMKNILKIQMSADLKNKYATAGIPLRNGDLGDAITASMVLQAMQGNVGAYTTIRDTMGYKPIEQVKNDVVVKIEMSKNAKELGE